MTKKEIEVEARKDSFLAMAKVNGIVQTKLTNKSPEPIITLIGTTGWDGKSIGGTMEPIKLIASQVLNMGGKMHHNTDEITDKEAINILQDLKRTALAGALETIDMVFQIENLPRSLTHQMVRTRVGATYHQESLRFTTREDGFNFDIGDTIMKTPESYDLFTEIMDEISWAYKGLIELGISMEDARGVLPIATLTKIGVKYNFKTLVHCGHVRLCFQSQKHWNKIFNMIKQEISTKIHPLLAEFLVPICQTSGRCEYKSIFDRVCPKETVLIQDTCKGCISAKLCEFHEEGIKESACSALKKMHRLDW